MNEDERKRGWNDENTKTRYFLKCRPLGAQTCNDMKIELLTLKYLLLLHLMWVNY